MTSTDRDYERIRSVLGDAVREGMTRHERMQTAADVFWEHLAPTGVSWIGFYTLDPGDDEMLLGPRRDKPACSPIGLHGACGQSATTKTTLVVNHVKHLGDGYVACDPKDTSELVIPCMNPDGTCWGVLDADSLDEGSFNEIDARELGSILNEIGLSAESNPPIRVV
ncbi:MAG: GAF domain-containing protein [Planctomycetota bacterium]